MSFVPAGIDLQIKTDQYDAAMRSVVSDAGRVDGALDGIVDAANRAERALNDIDGAISVRADVNDQELRDALDIRNDLDTDASMKVNVSDSELTAARRVHQDVDQDADMTVNVDRGQLDAVVDIVTNLVTNPVTIAVGVAGAGVGAVSGLAGAVGVGAMIEMDTALQRIEGTTNRMIPQAEQLIIDLYTDAWGDSRTAIADVITQAANLRIANEDLEDAIQSAFDISNLGIGETDEALRTMDTMVKNNLAPNFRAAADIIVTGFQNGANRGDDLLDTFNEYGSSFKELGLTGEEALAIINSGLDAGVDNSDRIADAVREIRIRLGEIGENETIANAFTQLDSLSDVDLAGLLDAYNAGEVSGGEFFNGFFTAIRDAQAADPEAAHTATVALVGTIAEDFGTETIAQLSPKWDETWGVLEGRAEQASSTVNNNLARALTGLARTLEQEFIDVLNNVVDVDALIERAKEAISVFSAELQAGSTISEAAAIALEIDPASIQRIESVFGNIGIVLAQAIATALEVLGQGDAADALMRSIRPAIENQLVFDLQVAQSPEDIRDIVQLGLSRGIEAAEVGQLIGQSLEEMLTSGDIAGAEQLVSTLEEMASVPIRVMGVEFAPGTSRDEIRTRFPSVFGDDEIESQIDQGFAAIDILGEIDQSGFAERIDQAVADMEQAWIDAVNTADFETAVQQAISLDDPALWRATFDAAVSAGLPDVAQMIADEMATQGVEGADGLETVADAMVAKMRADFSSAVEQGDLALARELAEQLGDEELLNALDAVVEGFNELILAGSTTTGEVGAAAEDMTVDVNNMGDNTRFVLDNNAGHWEIWSQRADGSIRVVTGRVDDLQEKVNGLLASMQEINETPVSSSVPEAAPAGQRQMGGVFEADRAYQFHADEIAMFEQGGSVINAATSRELMTALSSLGLGGGGSQVVNNYVTINQSNHARTQAQAAGIGLQTYRMVRGYT